MGKVMETSVSPEMVSSLGSPYFTAFGFSPSVCTSSALLADVYKRQPLVWLTFVLLGRDMEMSCDEAVMKKLGETGRADYSASLLRLATGRKIIAGAPLAFGEGDTRDRVVNVLKWRRPRLWAVLAGAAVCAAVIAACAVNPPDRPADSLSLIHI